MPNRLVTFAVLAASCGGTAIAQPLPPSAEREVEIVRIAGVIAAAFAGEPLGRLNLIVDAHGGAYFTVGGAFYTDADGRVTSLGDNLDTNGIILSADERTLYVTNGAVIAAFDVTSPGVVANRRDFARLEAGGNGDGLAIDGAGRLYVVGGGAALGTNGTEFVTPEGVRNDAKTIYKIETLASGFAGRPK